MSKALVPSAQHAGCSFEKHTTKRQILDLKDGYIWRCEQHDWQLMRVTVKLFVGNRPEGQFTRKLEWHIQYGGGIMTVILLSFVRRAGNTHTANNLATFLSLFSNVNRWHLHSTFPTLSVTRKFL